MTDSAPTNQAAILAQIDAAAAQLRRRLDRIDEAHGGWPGAVGDWSVVQLLQHMHGWLAEMNAAVERMQQGRRPAPDGVSYADVDAWNAQFVQQRGKQSYAESRSALEAEHARFRANVAALDPARFGAGKTINSLVDGTVIHHYAEHSEDLDAYLGGAES